jgi:hypothetical protein
MNDPGASPCFRWRTRGPVDLGGGLPLQVEQFEAEWAGSAVQNAVATAQKTQVYQGKGWQAVVPTQLYHSSIDTWLIFTVANALPRQHVN